MPVFDLNGNLKTHLVSGGALNSPWGVAIAPPNWGAFGGALLVGNFGDGKINAFDLKTGNPLGTLNDAGGNPIVLTGTHHCLVAEISYSATPIPPGISTANCGQLAQRNLQIAPSDNPGPPSAHRVPQTFDMRPSAPFDLGAAENLLNWPDEVVIDWGNVPEGSRASIYWPQVQATDVIGLAARLYVAHLAFEL